MNKELLYQLYAIHSPSGNEKKMRKFLKLVAKEYGADSIEVDAVGNLLITKGESDTFPCMAAHMDQVQDFHSKDFQIVEVGNDVLGYSPKCHKQQGLGADDKNGIFICLEMLHKLDAIKIAFFVGEECGCIGSSKVDLSFFSDCRFIIEPDRKGKSDLITSMYCGDVCSKQFIDEIGYKEYGYKVEHGTITDVGTLVERGVGISCLNLSCGYYDAHTDHEITNLSELENCMCFVEHILTDCTDVYPFECVGYGGYGRHYGSKISSYGKYGGYDWYDDMQDYWDDEEMYYNDGYYYDDYQHIEECFRELPNITFDLLKNDIDIFHVSEFFDKDNAERVLADVYNDVKAYLMDERECIGELVA